MLNLGFTVGGAKELLGSLSEVQQGLVDFRELGTWRWVTSEFYKIEKEIFDSEGHASAAGKWAELSSPYKERKHAKYGPVPILQASGKLYKSLTSQSGDSVVIEEAQNLSIGTTLKYATYHGTGTGRMPKRNPIELTNHQKKRLGDPIRAKLRQLVKNAMSKGYRGF